MYLICKHFEKPMLMLILFYKWWKPRFLISKRVFRWFLLNYIEFAHQISHIKAFQIWLNLWYQNLHMFEKSWGMRLWIGTSTFKKRFWRFLSTESPTLLPDLTTQVPINVTMSSSSQKMVNTWFSQFVSIQKSINYVAREFCGRTQLDALIFHFPTKACPYKWTKIDDK